MEDTIWQIIQGIATAAVGWSFAKLQTRRERKKSDLQIINDAISPLLTSVQSLTEYNNKLVLLYLDEQRERLVAQEKNKALEEERDTLSKKVSQLTDKIDKLEKTIKKLAKNEKDLFDSD